MRALAAASVALLLACHSQAPDPQPQKSATVTTAATPPPDAATGDAASTTASAADAGAADAEAAAPEETLTGAQYPKQIKAAFRVAGCGGDDALIPPHIDKKIVELHCGMLTSGYAEYKREWLEVAGPFIAKIRPASAPTTVVYPFGGGDLVSALATYPDATEITTISLEIAGDIRPIDKVENKRLDKELATLRDHLGKLFLKAHSRTINMDIETKAAVPGELAFTMAALVIHGFEPVTLRYFSFSPDGTLKYLSEEDIAKNEKNTGRGGPFANAELRFKKPGDAKVRVLRHVAYDLSDASMKRSPGLLKHLESKGKPVSTMTKAASHLLWDDQNFAVIRNYLMTHTDWMISDTTGVPPRVAKKYGFVQDFYGTYLGAEPFGTVNNNDVMAFINAFKTAQPISFRYGYPDNKSHGHIVVTRKP